jgi:NAD(P)H-dependent FMN reductase
MRANSQSLKVSKYLAERLNSFSHESELLDLHEASLPMFDDGETKPDNLAEIIQKLKRADGFVFVSPEWDGMMSLGLMNLIHYANDELAHKPVMLVGVSSGLGGAYPIAQMKQIGQKNKHYVISPENLRVAFAEKVLNDQDFSDDSEDISLKLRADYALKILVKYSESLKILRQDPILNNKDFKNGV